MSEILATPSVYIPVFMGFFLGIVFFILNRLYWLRDWLKLGFGLAIFLCFAGALLTMTGFVWGPSEKFSDKINSTIDPELGLETEQEDSKETKYLTASSNTEEIAYTNAFEEEKEEEDIIEEEASEIVQEEPVELINKPKEEIIEKEAEQVHAPAVSKYNSTAASVDTSRDCEDSDLVTRARSLKDRLKSINESKVIPDLEKNRATVERLKAAKKNSRRFEVKSIELETLTLLLNSRIGYMARDIKKYQSGQLGETDFAHRVSTYEKSVTELMSTYELHN